MKKLQKALFIYNVDLIIFIIILSISQFTKHNHLKKHINTKSDHLINNISQVDSKLDVFKQETKENFTKINQKIDEIEKTLKEKEIKTVFKPINTHSSETNEDQKPKTNEDQKLENNEDKKLEEEKKLKKL